MMKTLLFFLSIVPTMLVAGETTILSPSEAKEFGIIFKPWATFKQFEIEEHKESNDCTFFEIRFPQTKPNGKQPKYIHIMGGITFEDRAIAWLDFPLLTEVNNPNVQYTQACLPINEKFDASITFIYGTGALCYPSYNVPSVKEYLRELDILDEL